MAKSSLGSIHRDSEPHYKEHFSSLAKKINKVRPFDNCASNSFLRKIAVMNRKEAIMGIATIAAAAAIPSVASAQKPEAEAENPELEPLRALMKAYDTAFTNQDLNGVMATMSEKAAMMGSGPGEIWSGAD